MRHKTKEEGEVKQKDEKETRIVTSGKTSSENTNNIIRRGGG